MPAAIACHAVADAGGPYTAECQGPTVTLVLDGSNSPSCPGETIEYSWSSDCPDARFDDATRLRPLLTLESPPPCPVVCTVTLTAYDVNSGSRDSDHATVTIDDTLPPVGGGEDAILAILWPPDHRYVCFEPAQGALAAAFTDACSGVVSWTVVSCTSSEPDDAPGLGDGRTRKDCLVAPDGGSVCARAERSGNGHGRRYQLLGEATDRCGNVSGPVAAGALFVPHDSP